MQDLLTIEEREALGRCVRSGEQHETPSNADAARRALAKAERAKDPEHEGYTTRETWGVGLVFSGSMDLSDGLKGRAAYEETRDIARRESRRARDEENVAEGIWTIEQAAKYRTAEALKDYVEERLDGYGAPTLTGDLIGCALCDVDWDQLAEHALQALAEEDAA